MSKVSKSLVQSGLRPRILESLEVKLTVTVEREDMERVDTITIETAAARLQTESDVIKKWIEEGRIPTVNTDRGIEIPLAELEVICSEIIYWIAGEKPVAGKEPDKEGMIRLTKSDIEQFWRDAPNP